MIDPHEREEEAGDSRPHEKMEAVEIMDYDAMRTEAISVNVRRELEHAG